MDKLLIRGGRLLQGEVAIAGAKNAALPELCAALLTADTLTLANVPRLQDVSTMVKLIRHFSIDAYPPNLQLCSSCPLGWLNRNPPPTPFLNSSKIKRWSGTVYATTKPEISSAK